VVFRFLLLTLLVESGAVLFVLELFIQLFEHFFLLRCIGVLALLEECSIVNNKLSVVFLSFSCSIFVFVVFLVLDVCFLWIIFLLPMTLPLCLNGEVPVLCRSFFFFFLLVDCDDMKHQSL